MLLYKYSQNGGKTFIHLTKLSIYAIMNKITANTSNGVDNFGF